MEGYTKNQTRAAFAVNLAVGTVVYILGRKRGLRIGAKQCMNPIVVCSCKH